MTPKNTIVVNVTGYAFGDHSAYEQAKNNFNASLDVFGSIYGNRNVVMVTDSQNTVPIEGNMPDIDDGKITYTNLMHQWLMRFFIEKNDCDESGADIINGELQGGGGDGDCGTQDFFPGNPDLDPDNVFKKIVTLPVQGNNPNQAGTLAFNISYGRGYGAGDMIAMTTYGGKPAIRFDKDTPNIIPDLAGYGRLAMPRLVNAETPGLQTNNQLLKEGIYTILELVDEGDAIKPTGTYLLVIARRDEPTPVEYMEGDFTGTSNWAMSLAHDSDIEETRTFSAEMVDGVASMDLSGYDTYEHKINFVEMIFSDPNCPDEVRHSFNGVTGEYI